MGLASQQKTFSVACPVTVPAVGRMCSPDSTVFIKWRPQRLLPEGVLQHTGAVSGCGCGNCVECSPSTEMKFQAPFGSDATESQETVPELGGHEIVQDWIDGGIDVGHDATEVQDVVVGLQSKDVFLRCHDDPEGESAEGHKADEERQHHGAKHHHYLLPVSENTVL